MASAARSRGSRRAGRASSRSWSLTTTSPAHGASPRRADRGSTPPPSTRRTRRRIVELIAHARCDAVLNAVDPRFVMPIFRAALAAGVTYLDMAMSLSAPRPRRPLREDRRDARATSSSSSRRRSRSGACSRSRASGSSPGSPTSSPAMPPTTSSRPIEEVGVRDGANLVIDGYDFAPTFSIWTTIEECLNPPVIWERDRGWFTTEPFSEPEEFVFPAGIGAGDLRQRRARGGLPRAAVARRRPRHLQVRAERRLHRRAEGRSGASGSTGRSKVDGRRRRGLAARRRRGLPAGSRGARSPHARRDLRGDAG